MMRVVRFLAGLTMVVVGVALAAPMVTRVMDVWLAGPGATEGAGGGAAAWAGAPDPAASPAATAPAVTAPVGAGAYCIPDSRPGQPLPAAPAAAAFPDNAAPVARAPVESAGPEGGDERPPSPPPPLPVPPGDLSLAPPAFPASYRSTLDVPPPPLLDVDSPSPLVMTPPSDGVVPASAEMGGQGPDGAVQARQAAYVSQGFPGGTPAGTLPPAGQDGWRTPAGAGQTWTVRDGDDLTGIATRLYGHPGAAEAIWNANRDRIADPTVLPIGLSLRLPATWTPRTVRSAGTAPLEPSPRPGRVRVGQGETLETLAIRFYGDKSWAPRLWEANRDTLRNPALLVAGMELRLP